MIKLLAVFVTLVAASMTAVAAFDRGGTTVDKALLVAMSVVIVLAVHLLPAISRRPAAWLVWTGCLLCAVYGHLTFLTHASLRAGNALAQQSALTVGTERQIEITREALSQIQARPVAIVAAELAQASDKRVRAALSVEIAEGKKAQALRDGLVKLSGESTKAQVDGATDPVTVKLAAVLGVTEGVIAVSIGLTFSMLLELIGALLWVEALRPSSCPLVKTSGVTIDETPVTNIETSPVTGDETPETSLVTNLVTQSETQPVTKVETQAVTPVMTSQVSSPVSELNALQKAIQSGKCKATVNGIREFLGCSQTKAQELRRELA